MNIGLDARPLVGKKAGIGYYLENMLINILKKDTKNKYYLISDRNIDFDIKKFNNVFKIRKNGFLKKTLWYLFKVNNIAKKNNLDIFWGTQHILPINLDKSIKTVLTVHDLVFYEMPETMSKYNKMIMCTLFPISVRKSKCIITVSKSTNNGLKKHFPKELGHKMTKMIYEGADYFKPSFQKELEFYNKYKNMQCIKNNNYLLYVGTIEPRKNIELLLTAYEYVKESVDLKLVICGKIGWKCNNILAIIENNKYNKDITYLNYVTNEDKFLFMKNAFAFVFPSKYEGFGLPVVEAMKMGTVTLTTRSSSLDELIEKDELKFADNNPLELKKKILMLHSNPHLYKECKNYCIKRAEYFSWEKAADEYLKIFRSVNEK